MKCSQLTGLRNTLTSDGVWRIQKREKAPRLELFKLEETGTGDILSENFVRWRTTGLPRMMAAKSQGTRDEQTGES